MTERQFVKDEVVNLAVTSDVLPFCVYHWVDPSMAVYRGYVSGPSVSRGKDGKFKYKCSIPAPMDPYGEWSLAFTFYAINPMVRPIPNGMGLFCAQRRESFPWDTTKISLVYDPFDIDSECVYFIAYTRPTPWTKPLYIHVQGTVDFPRTAFPTWDPNPPVSDIPGKYVLTKTKFFSTQPAYKWVGKSSEESQLEDGGLDVGDSELLGWHHARIFPFFVLSPELFGHDYEGVRFTCHNATCFPYNPNNDYVEKVSISINERLHDPNKPTPRRLRECVVRCNQLVPEELGGGKPFDLIALISSQLDRMVQESPSIGDRLSRVSPIVIAVLVVILVASLAILIYFSLRRK